MISQSPSPSDTRIDKTDAGVAYRQDVLRLLARLGLEPTEAVALLEANTGRRFETCSPAQLVPLLQELMELLHSHRSPVEARQLEL